MREQDQRQSVKQAEGDLPAPAEARSDFVMERFRSIQDAGRSFDIEYWQRQGDAAIYRAAWELVEFYHRDQGMEPVGLRLQRSLENLQRA
jgi:hypothetical protein